jgi:hypothetical protein
MYHMLKEEIVKLIGETKVLKQTVVNMKNEIKQ